MKFSARPLKIAWKALLARKPLAGFFFILVLPCACPSSLGQFPNPGTLETQQGPEIPANKIRLGNGTKIRLLLLDSISSKTAKTGGSVRLRVLDDVKVDNLVIIAKRTTAVATLTATHPAHRAWRTGGIAMRMDSVTLIDQQTQPIQGGSVAKGTATDASGQWAESIALSGGLAIFFLPFAPLQHGHQAILPKGTVFAAITCGEALLDRSIVEASQPVLETKHGAASVTVYYPDQDVNESLRVWCGRARVAKVRRNHKFTIDLPAGKYVFQVGPRGNVKLQAEEGGEYYLKPFVLLRAFGGEGRDFDLKLMEHDVGEVESADLIPVKPNDAADLTKLDLTQLQADPLPNAHP